MTADNLTETAIRIRAAIERFMQIWNTKPDEDGRRLRSLARALDSLVDVYFETIDVEPLGSQDAPKMDYAVFYQRAGKSFPELGLYPFADAGGEPGEEECLVADAIDDLGDIAGDLAKVEWHFENSTIEEAIWDFRFGYQHHWGDHLHSLRNYLHSTRIAAW